MTPNASRSLPPAGPASRRGGLGEALLHLAESPPEAMASPEFPAPADTRPALVYLATDGSLPPEALWSRVSGSFSELSCLRRIEEFSSLEARPMGACVALADFRNDPLREFGESDVLGLGRLQAWLPQAVIVLLTPALNVRLQRLIHRCGVRRIFSEPVDWEPLAASLEDLARRISRPSAGAKRRETALLEICLAMGSTLELQPLLDKILALLMSDLEAQQGSILLFDRETDQLKMIASRGLPEEISRKGYVPRKGSIAEWVIDQDEPLILQEDVRDERFSAIGGRRPIVSSLCVPLRAKGEPQGTINLNRLAPSAPFTNDELDTAVILAAHAAASIENARLYEANLQAERLATVGQTVAGISHSMKSIITSLRGGISFCEGAQYQRDWDLMEKGWGLVRRNFERMSSMALDMLEYSKSERAPVRTTFPVEEFAGDLISTARARASAKEVILSTSIDPALKTLRSDPDQLFRAVLNILENAVDAVPSGGAVELGICEGPSGDEDPEPGGDVPPRWVHISIRDNGPGIPPEERAKIFAPFFSTKGSKGTGLGLAVSQKTIQEHGGRIVLESEPGKGAKFTIVIPC